jgi:putative FmdB family regulatory protein
MTHDLSGAEMPIFEYVCGKCDNRFETLVRSGSVVECPSCNSTNLEKQLSVFNASVATAFGAAKSVPDMSEGACGMCGDPRGPGACSLD